MTENEEGRVIDRKVKSMGSSGEQADLLDDATPEMGMTVKEETR